MFIMGLTGNISCGKSSVSKMLASRGAIIVDADLLSREIYEYDDVLEEMKLSFPEALVNGKIDRRVLAGIVFSDKARLEDLNRISHKKIYELVCRSLERNRDRDLVVIDAALLLEAKFDSLADKVVLVYCNEKVQLDRLMKRDSISSEDALKRIRSQMSQEDKKKMADLALSLVKEQSLLFFDVSTLMLEVSQKLTKSVTVYSHSLDNALVLSGKEGIDFHLLGGRFYSKNRFYYSLHEAQLLQHLQFDLAFFGAASLSQGVVSYEDEEDVAVKQLAMQAARTKILIAESDKYEKHSKDILGKNEDFDYWITDKKPDPDLVESLKDKVTILYNGKDSDYE